MNVDTGVVIVAAGSGKRMGAGYNKIWLTLEDKPILEHTVQVFADHPEIGEVVLVISEQDLPDIEEWASTVPYDVKLALGGAERQDSVRSGLAALSPSCEYVLIHDAARPFITPAQISETIEKVREADAIIVAVPVKDTIKVVNPEGVVEATPRRESLWAVQTPQAFRLSLVIEAHARAMAAGLLGTDDASLVEWMGYPVTVVMGSYENIKITTPEDLVFGEEILRKRKNKRSKVPMMRIGQGFDVHQLVEGRPLIIGGITIPYEKGLLGHSDADVLLHAITDAILGAIGEGDIGRHFPDTDPRFKDADSLKLLLHCWKMAKARGYELGNLDATIIAQAPKMAPHIISMQELISVALDADLSQVNIKATTTEKLGFTGRGEGIAAQAVCLLVKQESK
ncbi:bifunctional 2-C-methyl-D-erythritol 4-phosphate cytidylyltransferase/2-C-methyl-D-erythritol 2,4-cyclodiphosphate synthase [Brevibacillus dissolubilis]|uniref:bifunctional 2-C-methyl-D-erythritol 4-phosphate cytidylyltransferase/2-C-methyl-D-erythritol 2,4-cyclodiphosphate synthase n=1 Tax=Brevibacillus dissolubilis TaxID=1844116 RepID=UPI0011173A84|nr:bifunctional 2-C-methyl-D-erythritol 4-phosphate cytidylyltransferase/2-C-methyl-D-erythritol 2,4-cyclodiphosphate synthase [Brevibacillus dissolubilis]